MLDTLLLASSIGTNVLKQFIKAGDLKKFKEYKKNLFIYSWNIIFLR